MEYNNSKRTISIFGIITGIIIIIIGLTNFNANYCSYVSKETYGGDAYTGIQQAAAQAANNAYYINRNLVLFCRIAFIITGVLVILHYLCILSECKKTIEKE